MGGCYNRTLTAVNLELTKVENQEGCWPQWGR
jgi:hypothetical protein